MKLKLEQIVARICCMAVEFSVVNQSGYTNRKRQGIGSLLQYTYRSRSSCYPDTSSARLQRPIAHPLSRFYYRCFHVSANGPDSNHGHYPISEGHGVQTIGRY